MEAQSHAALTGPRRVHTVDAFRGSCDDLSMSHLYCGVGFDPPSHAMMLSSTVSSTADQGPSLDVKPGKC